MPINPERCSIAGHIESPSEQSTETATWEQARAILDQNQPPMAYLLRLMNYMENGVMYANPNTVRNTGTDGR